MPIKMLAFDLDGTTITQHRFLSPKNRETLIKAGEQGVILVPATGRMKDFVPKEITEIPYIQYLITSNGAVVYDRQTEAVVYSHLIPNHKARRVQAVLDNYDIYIEYYREGKAITKTGFPQLIKSRFHFPDSKIHFISSKDYTFTDNFSEMLAESGLCPEKINLPYLEPDVRRELWQRLSALGGLRLTSSIPDNIEINSLGADKGSALTELAEGLGISPENVMAIGDNGNDITMLQAAGVSVAVADGSADALSAAKYETSPHNEDGLAKAIYRFILEE